ncbi:hypothetical protein SGQ44_16205 [Flavobacterium sp. Fl-77]|uniref:Uncharacterized protein n=1 Tax=Flavobacterium flavipigmentatum TaxID=2893884 RepID=A0AAJ2SDT5_9FLAO|nr:MULTISPECIES: hypothetical protein [unclassified Flavobacterium]MDX6183730.1 hypothetical protein [Flavobacterium sp. Fl-33]MDX6187309.1 hypothetical protein [Flavobacterium sp. Fl-77]UFH38124.1 hypothetical protein LNP22_15450 [Flavobacterium sp. F-70]
MTPQSDNNFDQFEKPAIIRRKLLPWWMKTFCWIFMIMGLCGLIALPTSLFINRFHLSFYGFETNVPISITGLIIIAVFLFKGFAAYSLWFEKENAISIGKFDAILGVVLCLISMFVMPFISEDNKYEIRLELLLLILYFRKLSKIEYEWDNLESL